MYRLSLWKTSCPGRLGLPGHAAFGGDKTTRYPRRYNMPMADARQVRGRVGEEAAQAYLERQGYTIVDINVRLRGKGMPRGELDVVAWDCATLCFVEVKTRQGRSNTVPAEAVTLSKQRQISRLALTYAVLNGLLNDATEIAFRFDVISVWLSPEPGEMRINGIELIRGAFLAPEGE